MLSDLLLSRKEGARQSVDLLKRRPGPVLQRAFIRGVGANDLTTGIFQHIGQAVQPPALKVLYEDGGDLEPVDQKRFVEFFHVQGEIPEIDE